MLPKPLFKVSLIESEGQHRYCVNDDPTFLPGVTGILNEINKPFLLQWAAKETALFMQKILTKIKAVDFVRLDLDLLVNRAKKQHRFIKEKAARIGSEAHGIFDAWIKHAPEAFDETPFAGSFNCWLKNNPFKIVAGDTPVASIIYGYGGKIDVALEENGKLIVGDFKTSKSIWPNHGYQVALYAQALKETYGLSYMPEGYIFRFEKDKPKYEKRKVRSVPDSFLAGKAALDLYNAQQLVHFSERETIKEKKEKIKKEI